MLLALLLVAVHHILRTPENDLYLELGGNAITYSVNYDGLITLSDQIKLDAPIAFGYFQINRSSTCTGAMVRFEGNVLWTGRDILPGLGPAGPKIKKHHNIMTSNNLSVNLYLSQFKINAMKKLPLSLLVLTGLVKFYKDAFQYLFFSTKYYAGPHPQQGKTAIFLVYYLDGTNSLIAMPWYSSTQISPQHPVLPDM